MRFSSAAIRSRRLRSSAISSRGDGLGGVGGRPVGQPGRGLAQVVEQLGRGAGVRAGVAGGVQPGGQALLRQPAGVARGREAGQERQADLAVELVEQPDRARGAQLQVGAELVVRGDPGLDQVVAGADQHPQPTVAGGVGGQRGEPAAVGAQHVGEQVGVEAVVLVPGGAVAGRSAVTCRLAMTNTVSPASSRACTTGPSPRSIATPATWWRCSTVTSWPARRRSASTVNRSTAAPVVVDDADGVLGPRPVDPGPPTAAAGAVVRGLPLPALIIAALLPSWG